MVRLTPRRWKRFVRSQRSPVVARWLRWTQTCRDLAGHYSGPPIGEVVTIVGSSSMPRAIIHASPEALRSPCFPEAVAALNRAIESASD
jgi:hypothetical protein